MCASTAIVAAAAGSLPAPGDLEFGTLSLTRALCPTGSLHDESGAPVAECSFLRPQGWSAVSSRSWPMVEPSSSSRLPERLRVVKFAPGLAALLACAPLVLTGGCAHLPEHPLLPVETAPAMAADAPLDLQLSESEARHPGESGFRLVIEGTEAFAIRAHSARAGARAASMCRPTSGTPTSPGCTWRSNCSRPPTAACTCGCWSTTWMRAPRTPASRRWRRIPTSKCACSIRSPRASGTLSMRGEGAARASSASTAACTTRAGSPTTASRWSADATWATNTSAPATRSISSISISRWSGPWCATSRRLSTATGIPPSA